MTAALHLAGLLLALTTAPSWPRPVTVADCEARRDDPEPYRCFQVLVRSHPATRATAEARLRARLARNAQDRAARLALALLARDRADPQAEAMLRSATFAMHRAGDARGEAHAGRALLSLLLSQNRSDEADQAFASFARAAEASGEAALQLAVKMQTARIAHRRAEYGRAWTLAKEVEAAAGGGPAWLQAEVLSAVGGALWGMGRHHESQDAYVRLVELARAEGDRYLEADALFAAAVATSRAARGFPPEVHAMTEQAVQAAIESGNAWAEASALMSLAQEPGLDVQRRIDLLERALVVLRRTRDLGNTCFALRELARWLQDVPGEKARAFLAADEAIRRAHEAGDRFHLARGMTRRWMLAANYWPRDRALQAGWDALDAAEAVRDLQRDDEARARVLSEWLFVYQQVVGYLLKGEPPDVATAFKVTERLRAQELLGALDAAGSTRALAGRRPEQAARQEVLDEIARTQQRLLDVGLGEADRHALLRSLDGLEVRERALRNQIASLDPAFATLRSPRQATLQEVQAALAPDQALLSYVLCQRVRRMKVEAPWVFVVTRDSARAVPLSLEASDPIRSVTALAGLVARRDGAEGEGATRLYRLLLQEALGRLPPTVTRLVVVPDAALNRVPFDALGAQPGAARVGARYEVTVVPSASLWLRLRGRPRAAGAALLALADPRWETASTPAIVRQAALWQGLSLGSLPRGRREARLALRSLSGAGEVLTGEQATERFLKTADLRRYALLHLAAHAVVDDDHPERSAIVLAPGAQEEDGLLQSREIVGLDLAGLVIVLSACRSSTGEVVAGEGPLSLARAFLQAGARAVVGNLWEVRDDEAERLMAAFYRELGHGRTVAAALAAARRERMLGGAPAAAWAGTVVLGDGDVTLASPTEAGRGSAHLWLGAGLLACLLGPLAVWWRRRTSRP